MQTDDLAELKRSLDESIAAKSAAFQAGYIHTMKTAGIWNTIKRLATPMPTSVPQTLDEMTPAIWNQIRRDIPSERMPTQALADLELHFGGIPSETAQASWQAIRPRIKTSADFAGPTTKTSGIGNRMLAGGAVLGGLGALAGGTMGVAKGRSPLYQATHGGDKGRLEAGVAGATGLGALGAGFGAGAGAAAPVTDLVSVFDASPGLENTGQKIWKGIKGVGKAVF
jgi:hypothetical protein